MTEAATEIDNGHPYIIYLSGSSSSGRDVPRERVLVQRNGTTRYYHWSYNENELGGWELHCTTGPAVRFRTGGQIWYEYGVLHRIGGPAIHNHLDNKFWYVRGVQYSEIEYNFWFPQ